MGKMMNLALAALLLAQPAAAGEAQKILDAVDKPWEEDWTAFPPDSRWRETITKQIADAELCQRWAVEVARVIDGGENWRLCMTRLGHDLSNR